MRSLIAVCAATFVLTAPVIAQSDPAHVPGELVIRFVTPPSDAMIAEVDAALGKPTWMTPRHAPHAKDRPGAPHPLSVYRVAKFEEDADLHTLIRVASTVPGVELATFNAAPEPAGFPNDPLFDQQWSHTKINTPAAWAISTGDTAVIVGVIDTGTRITHEDLASHVWVNDDPVNGIDDDANGFIDDTYGWDFDRGTNDISDIFGHGTQVAGIVGGQIDNGLGMAGIANLTVMTSKWWHTSGSDCSVAESVAYAVDNGAQVLNLSLSCACELPMTETAILYAEANDVVIVCSTGNGGSSTPHYPAFYPAAMAISAVNISDELPGFSTYGSHVDVAAPSPDILTCDESGDADYTPTFRGTSAAAPHVAGLAGFVRAVNPSLDANEVRNAINDNATDIGPAGFDTFFGNGRIDVGATIAAVVVTGCDADFDGSGSVEFSDLVVLLSAWGPCAGCPADLDGSGVVDFTDLVALLSAWGPC